ncbi:amidase [Acinetobacter nematophilus]|uniref:Amidase family protein n=1 Tax=Acinetobacter nematophilus TaxID=2994642 RepID=A0A9X3DT85_9GAMM|nr:amidase family protein [Acinetobacter nematophilus]MCX5467412.1 amidase family protein [Acinetobacter nematophilus]
MKYSEYIQYDGIGLAQLVQSKQIQAHELLEIAIQRAEQVNPKINAIVIPMYEQAMKNANNHHAGQFSGVPFLLKDLHQEFAGVATSYGSKSFKNAQYIAQENAEIVTRWIKSGVVTFGLTNSPEFGIKGITEPEAWGSCKNPWNLKYNSGGSSGGAASSIAAGIVPIAGASDGGGSIRIPASYCGLFGLKPSRGRTPWGPQISEAMHGAAMQHVLCKSVRDSAAMLDATQGSDHNALFNIQNPTESYLEIIQKSPKKLRIGFSFASPIGTHVSQDAVNAIQNTVNLLQSLGHIVEEASPQIDGMALAKDFITTWFSQCAYTVKQVKQQFGAKDQDFELDTLAIAAFGAKASALDYINNLNNWGVYVTKMNHFFSQYDLFLIPSTASVAPKNGEVKTPAWQIPILKALLKVDQAHLLAKGKLVEQLIKNNLQWVPFTQLANITGLPAMSVPLYWNKDHLPLGSQFIAPFGQEDTLLQLAAQLEQAQPWAIRYQSIKI